MLERGHKFYSFADEIAIYGRRRAKRSYAVAVYNGGQLLRLKMIKIIYHDRAAHQPLPVNFAP